MTTPRHEQFVAMVIHRLEEHRENIRQFEIHLGKPAPVTTQLDEAIKFLRTRLTDAAIHGCHHCGEGEPGTPCWWCGLKN